MLSFSDLNGPFGIFTGLSLSLRPGEITCLTGPNGAGKTTLLHLIQGLARDRGCAVALAGQTEARGENPVRRGSPGQIQRRVIHEVLRAVTKECILLLDEPSNHLDEEAFERLRERLEIFPGPMLIVTHDRRLLRSAQRILHLEAGRLWDYGGGCSLYEEFRGKEKASREADFERLRREVKHAERELEKSVRAQEKRRSRAERDNRTQRNPKAFVNFQRNRADRTEARLQRTHAKIVERQSEVRAKASRARLPDGLGFGILMRETAVTGEAMTASGLNRLRPDEKPSPRPEPSRLLLWGRDLSFYVGRGEKAAVTGPNGSGKTSLLRLLAGLDRPVRGRVTYVKTALLDQRLSLLDDAPHPFALLSGTDAFHGESDVRTFLAGIGFRGERAFLPLSSASGGERMRLAIAFAIRSGARVLLLDEPTNDLDADARLAVEEFLRTTVATVLLASHDEEFLEAVGVTTRIRL